MGINNDGNWIPSLLKIDYLDLIYLKIELK
jgi:hypothetical protein